MANEDLTPEVIESIKEAFYGEEEPINTTTGLIDALKRAREVQGDTADIGIYGFLGSGSINLFWDSSLKMWYLG